MEEKKRIITQASMIKLQEELDELVVNRRKEIADKIKEAREQGDLSENAEYDAAKDEQRDIEARIEEIENILKNCEILDENSINFNTVHLGCKVKVRNLSMKKEYIYEIVDHENVNSRERRITLNSPVGKALEGKEIGDLVEVTVPAGSYKYKILDIIPSNSQE